MGSVFESLLCNRNKEKELFLSGRNTEVVIDVREQIWLKDVKWL